MQRRLIVLAAAGGLFVFIWRKFMTPTRPHCPACKGLAAELPLDDQDIAFIICSGCGALTSWDSQFQRITLLNEEQVLSLTEQQRGYISLLREEIGIYE